MISFDIKLNGLAMTPRMNANMIKALVLAVIFITLLVQSVLAGAKCNMYMPLSRTVITVR